MAKIFLTQNFMEISQANFIAEIGALNALIVVRINAGIYLYRNSYDTWTGVPDRYKLTQAANALIFVAPDGSPIPINKLEIAG